MANRRGQESRNYFKISIEETEIQGFTRVSGLKTSIAVNEKSNSGKTNLEKLPGPSSCGNVTLFKKRTRDQHFWNWLQEIQNGNTVKKDVTIELVYRNKPLRGWKLINCWPCRWAISDITDDVLESAEEIELVVEKIELL